MSKLSQITQDLNNALKQKDPLKVSILRYLLAGLHNAKIEKGAELSDSEVLREVAKEAKRHYESISAYEKGQRSDLVEKEKKELSIIEAYLPQALSDQELVNLVDEAISKVRAKSISQMGQVIKMVMEKADGAADGAKVAQITKDKLGSSS